MSEDSEKRFDKWMSLKSDLHRKGKIPQFKEGDVWWCSIGENVGVEINGKSDLFSRPVLVLKKLSRYGFLGVPLTSQPHQGTWYVSFEFKNKAQVAALAQVRTFSAFRLHNRLGILPNSDLELVRKGFDELYAW